MWRDKTCLIVGPKLTIGSSQAKVVWLHARVWNLLDPHDGLPNALKPCVDALVRCGIIHDDSARSGHEFRYTQEIDRCHRGVEIVVYMQGT